MYLLTFEYSDRSSFNVCGITDNELVADAWYHANDETNVYVVAMNEEPTHWMVGIKGWRQLDRENKVKGAH